MPVDAIHTGLDLQELISKLDDWAIKVNDITSETRLALLRSIRQRNDECVSQANNKETVQQREG
jgi:predicted DNA-binding ribbon-helix-helix protein